MTVTEQPAGNGWLKLFSLVFLSNLPDKGGFIVLFNSDLPLCLMFYCTMFKAQILPSFPHIQQAAILLLRISPLSCIVYKPVASRLFQDITIFLFSRCESGTQPAPHSTPIPRVPVPEIPDRYRFLPAFFYLLSRWPKPCLFSGSRRYSLPARQRFILILNFIIGNGLLSFLSRI